MPRRFVMDLLRGIETESIEVKLVDPVAGIGLIELAHGYGVFAVEVKRLPPIGFVLLAEIPRGESREVVTVGTEVVVDDVEDDSDAEGMGFIHEGPQVV